MINKIYNSLIFNLIFLMFINLILSMKYNNIKYIYIKIILLIIIFFIKKKKNLNKTVDRKTKF